MGFIHAVRVVAKVEFCFPCVREPAQLSLGWAVKAQPPVSEQLHLSPTGVEMLSQAVRSSKALWALSADCMQGLWVWAVGTEGHSGAVQEQGREHSQGGERRGAESWAQEQGRKERGWRVNGEGATYHLQVEE